MKIETDTSGIYTIESSILTTGFFSYLHRIEDRYKSISDSTFSSFEFEKHIREGRYKKDEHIIFDQENKLAIYKENNDTIKISKDTKDEISSIYYLRTLELNPEDTIHVNIHTDRKNYNFKVVVKETELSGVKCLEVTPFSKETSLLGAKKGLILYFTNDKDKIPIFIKIGLPTGKIEAKLKRRITL